MLQSSRFIAVATAVALGTSVASSGACWAGAMLKPTTGVTQALKEKTLSIETNITGAFAKTVVTTTYGNTNSERTEADFVYTAPEGAVVAGFAYWYKGEKVVARVVEKKRAAQIYQYITSRMRDPALVEMIGPRTFRARIFPVEAFTDLKIEIKMVQLLKVTPKGLLWNFPLKEETESGPLNQLTVNATFDQPFTSNLGTTGTRNLKVERTDFKAQSDLMLNGPALAPGPNYWQLSARDGGQDGFFALAFVAPKNGTTPPAKIQGVPTYDVLLPNAPLSTQKLNLLLGRYKGSGQARLNLGGQDLTLNLANTTESGNAAATLWAARRLEIFGKKPAQKGQAMATSVRFGLPCAWTSWLAIPKEERANFKRQMWASDRVSAGRAYAQAVARGDKKTAAIQRQSFNRLSRLLQEDGPNYAASEELQDLRNFLNEELENVRRASLQGKYGKMKRGQLAQWKRWERVLRRAGARDGGKGVAMPVYLLEDEFRVASRNLIQEVTAGRGNGKVAIQLQLRLQELARTSVAKYYGWDRNSFLWEQAHTVRHSLAMNIASELLAGREKSKVLDSATNQLSRLARHLKSNPKQYVRETWSDVANSIHWRVGEEIVARREDGPEIRKLQATLAQARKLAGNLGSTYSDPVQAAWDRRAHEDAYQVQVEKGKDKPNLVLVGQLEKDLEIASKRTGVDSKDYLECEKWDAERKAPFVWPIGHGGSVGDPLIKVQAPSDSSQVVAVLPTGELKQLLWNGASQHWEGRFDIPGYTAQGPYKIAIIVVGKDGTRKKLTLTFQVDMTPSKAKGNLVGQDSQWNLSCEGDADVFYVDAWTPWGKRVPLNKKNGVFVGKVTVPSEWTNRDGAVTYVLTDQAHNRTNVVVDMGSDTK